MQSNDRTIAKNTFVLYLRMFLAIIVSLYTVRVVLHTLGVVDYGIYNVVAGFVGIISVLHSLMSNATSRFLTFELGKKDYTRLKLTFSTSLMVQLFIALAILAIGETIGLWYLASKLNIPENRYLIAFWVYQFSLIATMLNVTQTPYTASIISHEKMKFFAYVEILNVTLKLLIVYLLQVVTCDKLILYSILIVGVTFVITMIYRIYCIRHFEECKFSLQFDKEVFVPMFNFGTWSAFGSFCAAARYQGVDMVVNRFFGVVMNASTAIATSLTGTLIAFTNNVLLAFRPQIIKSYAEGNYKRFNELVISAIKLSFVLYFAIGIPLCFNMEQILGLWLVNVPQYAPIFCKLVIIQVYFAFLISIIEIGLDATGYKKWNTLVGGLLYIVILPLAYITFILGAPVYWAYIYQIAINVCVFIIKCLFLKKYLSLFSIKSVAMINSKQVMVLALSMSVILIFYASIDLNVFWRIILSTSVFEFIFLGMSFLLLISNVERNKILDIIKKM